MSSTEYKSTEIAKIIIESFPDSAKIVKSDSLFEKRFSESMDGEFFSLKIFVKNLKAHPDELQKYCVLSIEILNEKEFSDAEIEQLENEYDKSNGDGGYIKFLLEKIYDAKFKSELNKKIANYSRLGKTDSVGKVYYDFVSDFLQKLNKSNFNYSQFTPKKNMRSKKYKDKNKPVEPIDNPFSLFKCYAQGEYSKILIALNSNMEETSKENPDKLGIEGFEVILKDDAIAEFIPNVRYLPCHRKCGPTDYYAALTFERQELKITENLQRWFDDFVPSDLDRVYRKENGTTLRFVLQQDCKYIKTKVHNIHGNLIRKIYEDGDIFSGSQISRINKLYNKYYGESPEDKSVREKIELILQRIDDKEKKIKSWQEIEGRYYNTYIHSLNSPKNKDGGTGSEEIDGIEAEKDENANLEEEIDEIISSYAFEGCASKLFYLLCENFRESPDFIGLIAKRIESNDKNKTR